MNNSAGLIQVLLRTTYLRLPGVFSCLKPLFFFFGRVSVSRALPLFYRKPIADGEEPVGGMLEKMGLLVARRAIAFACIQQWSRSGISLGYL